MCKENDKKFLTMLDNPIYNYPIEKVLEALGFKQGTVKDMWFSPLRDEKEASLHVDRYKNCWYDHGIGIGGTNVKLVMLAKHYCQREAEKFIKALSPALQNVEPPTAGEQAAKPFIRKVSGINSDYLGRYLEIRKIPLKLAYIYCKQLQVHHPESGKNYLMLGFPNNSGGYAMASPSGIKRTNKADITTIDTEGRITTKPSSKKVAVFEGFWDYLSWMVMQCTEKPNSDIVVLNSVNNIQKAADYIRAHDSAYAFMDNDTAGKRCLNAVTEIMKGKEVTDMSELYAQHKDLNEMLQASRGYSANMRLTTRM